jgi:hypothetical protein
MAYSYFVYYQVVPGRLTEAENCVLLLLSEVRKATDIVGRLFRKRDTPALWLEIYENIRDDAAFELALAEASMRLEFDRFLEPESVRRMECCEH